MSIINEEIPNKYFYLQEQQKQTKKHIKQLQNEEDKILKTNSEILKECKLYYQKLYSKQQNCKKTQNEILQNLPKKLNEQQNQQLTEHINKNELKVAIHQMENEKSPGIDRIPIEFYKAFYDVLENNLLQLYNNILLIEKNTTKTMQQAIITLIPKKGNLKNLKNWTPVSLLCIDYKILTTILSNRLKTILPNIISEEQTWSIAFDKVDHQFLFKIMNKIGFSDKFIQFIKILYKNNISYIINNRFISSPVQLLKGLRQGCPLSLPLYIIHG